MLVFPLSQAQRREIELRKGKCSQFSLTIWKSTTIKVVFTLCLDHNPHTQDGMSSGSKLSLSTPLFEPKTPQTTGESIIHFLYMFLF